MKNTDLQNRREAKEMPKIISERSSWEHNNASGSGDSQAEAG